MKIILSQQVELEGDNFPHNWSKEYESNIIPHMGDYISDPIWKDPYEYIVTEITIDYYANECSVNIDKYCYGIPNSRKDEFAEMAKLHGWSASWQIK